MKASRSVRRGSKEVRGHALLNEKLRPLQRSLCGDCAVVPDHAARVGLGRRAWLPVQTVVGVQMDARVELSRQATSHVLGQGLEVVTDPPHERILDKATARQSQHRLVAEALVRPSPRTGHCGSDAQSLWCIGAVQ